MAASEADELTGELYLVPPERFVAARDELVRTARAAGNRELASALSGLRRPTLSAWLVNVLSRHEAEAMRGLRVLGRELRRAQTQLDAAGLRNLGTQRQALVADLLARARSRATDAGLRPTDAVLSEVEATLNAALVDLAASATALSGRLVRPMAHSGFGPMPHVDAPPAVRSTDFDPDARLTAGEGAEDAAGPEPAARPALRAVGGAGSPADSASTAAGGADVVANLAAAETLHWQREHELADAEGALAAAADRLEWLEQQRMEARREKVTAERHVTEARAAQRAAVEAVANARRALDAAERAGRHGRERGS